LDEKTIHPDNERAKSHLKIEILLVSAKFYSTCRF